MKMLIVVFRQSLDDEIRELLEGLKVKGFTEAPKVLGTGEAGRVGGTHEYPGYNSMILSALEDEEAKTVIARLQALHDKLAHNQHGAQIPLRVFVLPCEQAL
jgi:hypothetical protein